MYCKTHKIAQECAQDNADYFGVPYVVFCDTSGNWRCENQRVGPKLIEVETFYPRTKTP